MHIFDCVFMFAVIYESRSQRMCCNYIVPMREVIGDVIRTLADHFYLP